MKIKLTAQIKNFNLEIEDDVEDLTTWRKTVVKELNYLNKDIEEKGLVVLPPQPVQQMYYEPQEFVPEPEFIPATPAQLNLLARLGVTNIEGDLSIDEADRYIQRMKKEKNWK